MVAVAEIPRPLGLILEEREDGRGVEIIRVDPRGNAALSRADMRARAARARCYGGRTNRNYMVKRYPVGFFDIPGGPDHALAGKTSRGPLLVLINLDEDLQIRTIPI